MSAFTVFNFTCAVPNCNFIACAVIIKIFWILNVEIPSFQVMNDSNQKVHQMVRSPVHTVPSSGLPHLQTNVHFGAWTAEQSSTAETKRSSSVHLRWACSWLLAVGLSWRGMWQGREVVFGPDTLREGQTVTLCQPGRTRGTVMLNTISWSANGREFVVVFGGMCLFACLGVLRSVYVCVTVLVHARAWV